MNAPAFTASFLTPLAEWELRTQVQQALSSRLTGQIQITFLNDKTETIFVQNGFVRGLYVRGHRAPDINWESPLARFGRGTLVIESIPARALMFRKVAIEEVVPPAPNPSRTNQLNTMFSLAEHNPNPTLFHIHWEKAEAFVLVAGGRIPIRHAVLLTSSGTQEGIQSLGNISTWSDPHCKVFVYRGNTKNQAWLEIHLNILLEWYCQAILSNYRHLTGSVMVRSILQNLLVIAENKGWNISTHSQQLGDETLFANAAEAGSAYRDILSAIRARIEPIIGSSLTEYLFKQCIERTIGVYKTIQETFELIKDSQ